MLGIERSAARYTWTAAVVLLFLWLVYLLRFTLFIFAVALLFAYLLSPLVDLLDRAIPQIGTRVVSQAETLASKLPEMMVKLEQPSPLAPEGVNAVKAQLVASLRTDWAQRSSDIMRELPPAGLKFLS